MLLGQQSIALVAHGERARRIRHYLFTLEQQPRSFLRRLIASLGHDRRFRRGSYERRTSLRRAT